MNLSLLDPFVLAQDCPEALIGRLHSGHSTTLRFNRRGDLLASGRLDGTVVIFDVETNGVARKLRGHTHQIQSLSWSTDGRYLLSSSQDWKCILWDLQNGARLRTVRFQSAVFIAELHPHNHLLFTAALFDCPPLLVNVSGEVPSKIELPSSPNKPQGDAETTSDKQAAQNTKQTTTVTIFSPSGDHILTGTNRGWLHIIETASSKMVYSTRLANALIVLMRLTSSGRQMVVNASDKIIRTIHIPDLNDEKTDFKTLRLEVEHKFQDIVNKFSWNHVTFSSSGDYVVASTYMNHQIYVWERKHGSLDKILEGPREELSVVEWHPHKPNVAACGVETGRVYLWSILTPQRWSALAPDFAEVEENVEYVEREDEFDIHPIEEIHQRILNQEDEDIDVLTMNTLRSEELDCFRMPILLDVDDSDSEDEMIAVGTGQYRRKSLGLANDRVNEDTPTNMTAGEDTVTTRGNSQPSATTKMSASSKRRNQTVTG